MSKKRKNRSKSPLCESCMWNIQGECAMEHAAFPKASKCDDYLDENSRAAKEFLASTSEELPSPPGEGLRPAAKDGRAVVAHFETKEISSTTGADWYE